LVYKSYGFTAAGNGQGCLCVSAAETEADLGYYYNVIEDGEIEEIIAVCLGEAQKNSSIKKIIAGSEN
jgi:hypothetical protein